MTAYNVHLARQMEIFDAMAAAVDAEREAREKVLREALQELIYYITHLSPLEDDGSHKCWISAASLQKARAALGGKP
jgi:hypothetical protein